MNFLLAILKYRPTLLALMLAIGFIACCLHFVVIPAMNIIDEQDTFWWPGAIESFKPFWPQYWRRVRNVPEPYKPKEVIRSDDGGIVLMLVVAVPLAIGLAYRYRRYLVRRVDVRSPADPARSKPDRLRKPRRP